jgi:acetyl-CoA carboxylase biotin carboxyl carrier protein
MELREIKALVALMREHGLVELEIEDKKGKIRLVRGVLDHADGAAGDAGARPAAGKARRAQSGLGRAVAANGGSSAEPELGPNQVLVRSPMVGTFYRASSPEADPFVEEGSAVRKGQALCIIEAMKMMNEVEAEQAGTVVRILCDNGQPIEYGQPLIIIEAR